jgi:hypothetical protein
MHELHIRLTPALMSQLRDWMAWRGISTVQAATSTIIAEYLEYEEAKRYGALD